MNSIDDITIKLLSGKPIIFKDICLIYPPTLGDIATVGITKFYQYISVLLAQKPIVEDNQLKQIISKLSDFEYLLLLSQMDAKQMQMIKEAFHFFTHDDIMVVLDPPSVAFGSLENKAVLTKDSFYEFQRLIKATCAMLDSNEQDIEFLDSDTPMVRAMKMKMLEGRQKASRAKAKQQEKKDKKNSDVSLTDLIASLCIGSNGSLNLLNIWNLTYYAFQDQVKRMTWKEEFEINNRAAMAGAKISKDKLSHWIKGMTFK